MDLVFDVVEGICEEAVGVLGAVLQCAGGVCHGACHMIDHSIRSRVGDPISGFDERIRCTMTRAINGEAFGGLGGYVCHKKGGGFD